MNTLIHLAGGLRWHLIFSRHESVREDTLPRASYTYREVPPGKRLPYRQCRSRRKTDDSPDLYEHSSMVFPRAFQDATMDVAGFLQSIAEHLVSVETIFYCA